jgi:hypothetical protein
MQVAAASLLGIPNGLIFLLWVMVRAAASIQPVINIKAPYSVLYVKSNMRNSKGHFGCNVLPLFQWPICASAATVLDGAAA